jgi:hypothetical protein
MDCSCHCMFSSRCLSWRSSSLLRRSFITYLFFRHSCEGRNPEIIIRTSLAQASSTTLSIERWVVYVRVVLFRSCCSRTTAHEPLKAPHYPYITISNFTLQLLKLLDEEHVQVHALKV